MEERKTIVVWLSLLFLLAISVLRAEYGWGTQAAIFLGFLSALTLFLLGRLILNWHKRQLLSKAIIIILVLLISYPIIFPHHVNGDFDVYAATRESIRQAVILQNKLAKSEDFQTVKVQYFAPTGRKGRWLEVHGEVSNLEKFKKLYQTVEDHHVWTVLWQVSIDHKRPTPAEIEEMFKHKPVYWDDISNTK